MLPLPLGKSLTTDELPARLSEIIEYEHGKTAALKANPVSQALGDLRAVIWQSSTTPDIREELLVYLSTLNFVETVVNLKEKRWIRALDLDRIQGLFYLGLCDASFGVEEFKRREESYPALQKSASRFAKSAASFELAKALSMSQEASPDAAMTVSCFECYEHLMLGNCFYARYLIQTTADDENEEYCKANARYAAGAGQQYQLAADRSAKLDSDIRTDIGAPAKALAGYANAIAEMWEGKACEISQNVTKLVGRLRNARKALDAAYVDTSRLVNLEALKRELLDHIAVLDGELFAMQGSAEEKHKGVEAERNLPVIDPHEEEMFDIEDIVNCTPVDPTVEALALSFLPNGPQHEPTTERMQLEIESNSSLDHRDGIWMLQHPHERGTNPHYSATRNEYPNSHSMSTDSQDTILNLGNPFLGGEESTSMVQVNPRTLKFLAVISVFVFLRIVLI